MVEWIEIQSTDTEKLAEIEQKWGVHPLALEDCRHRDQKPKLDEYDSHQFLVWFMYAKEQLYEIQFIIFPDKLIVVPHLPPPTGETWKEYLRITAQTKSVWHLLYQALDRATDITWKEMGGLFKQVDDFEQKIFRKNFNPRSLLFIKKRLNQLDYSISLLASVARQLQKLCQPTDDLRWKLRDLHDHCDRISRSIDLYRSQIASSIELYWGLHADRSNTQIKKLSLLASISVPLTFWASFWGMNFEFIPYEQPQLFFAAMAVMVLSVAATTWLLIRKGYWDD